MFGDPEKNPLGWPVMRLDSIVTNSNNGITRRGNDPDGSIVLRIVELQDGFIDYSNINRMHIKDKEQKCLLVDGDLLFVRVNGNPDYVARSAVFSDIGEPVYHNDHIIRMHVDETKAHVRFIREFTTTVYAKKQLKDHIKTSAGQYSISQDGIGSIQIVLPPLDKQDQYISFLEQSDKSKFELTQAISRIDDMIKALMQG
jgi:type I restriction enzyme S subunit